MPEQLQASTASETQVQLNTVYLNSSDGATITSVTFNGTLEVSAGQPVNGGPVITQNSSTQWEIDLTCGRHGTSNVANDFVANSGGATTNLFGLDVLLSAVPSDLNFFFGIDVTFANQPSPVTIYLGQGHIPLTGQNNWWMGGSSLSNQSYENDGPITLYLPQGSVGVGQGGDDHTFQFS